MISESFCGKFLYLKVSFSVLSMAKKNTTRFKLTPGWRTTLCIITLLLIIAEEHFLNLWMWQAGFPIWALIGFVVILLLFGFLYWQHSLAKFEISTVRKLFQNLVSAPLSFFILLFFLIHLEWISNAGYDAFFTEEGFQWPSFVVMLINIAAVVSSVFLYPQHASVKAPHERELVISGLSMMKAGQEYRVCPRNIDLLIKPFLDVEWKGSNGAPLSSASRLVIIPSKADPISFSQLDSSYMDGRTTVFSFVGEDNKADVLEKYNSIISEGSSVQDVIRKLIMLLTGKEVAVALEKPVDYDDMKKALVRIAEALRIHEHKNGIQDTGNTLLYISPGTGVIGSALTAFAIPGDRCVLYFTQTKNDNELMSIGLETGGHNSIVEEMTGKE